MKPHRIRAAITLKVLLRDVSGAWGSMKILPYAWFAGACLIGATTLAAIDRMTSERPDDVSPNALVAAAFGVQWQSPSASAVVIAPFRDDTSHPDNDIAAVETPAAVETLAALEPPEKDQAKLEDDQPSDADNSAAATPPEQNFSYLVDYAYSEVPPDKKPADIVLDSEKDIPVGTPIEEIKRASDAFGMDFVFMKTVAKIESDFDPKERTGSYIGLFQLSHYEFDRYGSGEITNPRDNSVAAAYKFATEAILFELVTHKKPTVYDVYLIHQQGWQGAAEHISHPERIAWKSMCATDEGREKGEKWCKRAIWGNTLPTVKHVWKTVDNLTSSAFVNMWQERIDHFYARYSEAVTAK
jgi:hypothetical protein